MCSTQLTCCADRFGYYCLICRKHGQAPPACLKNISNYNKKYVCGGCVVIIANTYYGYQMESIASNRFINGIRGLNHDYSFMCEPMILPSRILKPFGKIYRFNLLDIEYRMRDTDIYKN
ncbi:hypothetical protein FQR65_LT10057 [Abscondita terminalis]|nr:hypothetical protein FQR65_LT10057 [Abscondita terminalis]